VIKDPIALKYSRLREEEFFILSQLDGDTPLVEIKRRFEREFTPARINEDEIQNFVSQLYQSGLVISSAANQGWQLRERQRRAQWKKVVGTLSNVFALRTKGVNPERLFAWLSPKVSWMFSLPMVLLGLCIGLAALLLVGVQYDTLSMGLPTFRQFFGPGNWLLIAASIGIVKVLHEFGHGLACKRYGGEVHELGLMMLVFTPAMYCNVSDSWLLESKWKRAAIGAAGMYVELWLASIATFLWWTSSRDTTFNQLCLNIMFVCSVSTLMFNGNPLLRFDGYYILADLIEVPNLRQKASESLRRWFFWLCLGVELPADPYQPPRHRWFLAIYTIASFCYRWFVVFSILFLITRTLEPYGLAVAGRLLGLFGVVGMIGQPTWQLIKFFRSPGNMKKIKRHRVVLSCLALAAVLAVILLLPLPHHVKALLEVQPRNASAIYIAEPGVLAEIYKHPGDLVRTGERIARLENKDFQLEKSQLTARRDQVATEIKVQQRLQFEDRAASLALASLEEQLQTIEDEIAKLNTRIERLDILAPADGMLIAAPAQDRPSSSGELKRWSGSLLREANLGSSLERGEAIGQIGNPAAMDAVLVVDQNEIEFVTEGQTVNIQIESQPGRIYQTKIYELAPETMQTAPESLTTKAGGSLAAKSTADGQQMPMSASYHARAKLSGSTPRAGVRGQAKIKVGSRPLGTRIYRWASRLFHFEL